MIYILSEGYMFRKDNKGFYIPIIIKLINMMIKIHNSDLPYNINPVHIS